MNMHLHRRGRQGILILILALGVAGCATHSGLRDGPRLIDEGRYEEGLAQLESAVHDAPRDSRARLTLTTLRQRALAELLSAAERARLGRDMAAAVRAYDRVLAIEPGNERALEALRQIEALRNVEEMVHQARLALRRGDAEAADSRLRQIFALDPRHPEALALRREIEDLRLRNPISYPQLRSRLEHPVTLEFREGNLKQIFEVLARTTGINFIFDKEVKPDLRATLFLRQVPVEQAVELLLLQNQLQQKIINENTVLIYPDSPQKQREYQDLTIRAFQLANIDAKSAMNLLKTVLKSKDVFIDERLNTLVLRDTPDAVRLAEKLLLTQGLPEPEVVLEVEVLEISRQRILDLGLQWPSTFGVLRPDLAGPPGVLDQLRGIDSKRITIGPSPELRINAQDNDVNTLANPVIRVSNKEKARVHIGQRVPVVSATSTPSTQGPVITESIQYLEVGLKLEVEPTVHLNDEVMIRIGLEVSKATPLPATRNGTIPVQVDTRNAATSLRLKDGETQVLAGLMRNDHDVSGNRIPGLGDIPGLGRLFGSNKDTIGKSELVLSITPRVVRNMPYMSAADMEFSSGTEATLRLRSDALLRSTAKLAMRSDTPSSAAAAGVATDVAAEPVLAAAVPSGAADSSGAGGAGQAGLVLDWSAAPALKVGEETDLVLRANSSQPVESVTLQLAFDPAVLKVLAATEGDLLKRDGAVSSFAPRIDGRSGSMYVAMSRGAGAGVSGEGELLKLRVVALQPTATPATLRVTRVSAIGAGRRVVQAGLPAALELTASE